MLSGLHPSALCIVETPGRHAASGGVVMEEGGADAVGLQGTAAAACGVNNVAVGALYAHLQW